MRERVGYLIEWSPDVNGAVLDHIVHRLRDGGGEVRVGELERKAMAGKPWTIITPHTIQYFVLRGSINIYPSINIFSLQITHVYH